MPYQRISGLVALGLALLSCTSVVERYITQPPPEVHIQTEAVFKLLAVDKNRVELGTSSAVGINIKEEGDHFILTCLTAKHAIENDQVTDIDLYIAIPSTYDSISTNRFSEMYKVNSIDKNIIFDLALIKINIPRSVPIVEISLEPLVMAQEVICVGIPLGMGIMITEGFLSHFDIYDTTYMVSANTLYGTSGGALFDKKTGKLIGINVGIIKINMPHLSLNQAINYMNVVIMLNSVKSWLLEKGI